MDKKAGDLVAKAYSIKKEYKKVKSIGSGQNGKVYLYKNKRTNEMFAMKKLFNSIESRNEILLQWRAAYRSPYVLKIIDLFEDRLYLYLVTEYMSGGDLGHRIIKDAFDEKEVFNIMIQIFRGVKDLHLLNICHRDLKPENILLKPTERKGEWIVKISDFGFAKMTKKNAEMDTPKFTPQYASPQVHQSIVDKTKKYTIATDIWSLGVIMFVCCCRHFPYTVNDQVCPDWRDFYVSYDSPAWALLSAEARQLISSMLEPDVEKRFDMDQILNSRWVAKWQRKDAPFSLKLYTNRIINITRVFRDQIERLYNQVRIEADEKENHYVMLKMLDDAKENNELLRKRTSTMSTVIGASATTISPIHISKSLVARYYTTLIEESINEANENTEK